MSIVRRSVAAALSLCLLASCATVLYPERRGNDRGRIDVGPLVLDVLWFIPGIIPGVIALAVDFGSGAIYENGPSTGRMRVGREGTVAIHEPKVEAPTHVELRLVDLDREVLAADSVTWHPDDAGDTSISISLSEAAARIPADEQPVALQLELVVDGKAVARRPVEML